MGNAGSITGMYAPMTAAVLRWQAARDAREKVIASGADEDVVEDRRQACAEAAYQVRTFAREMLDPMQTQVDRLTGRMPMLIDGVSANVSLIEDALLEASRGVPPAGGFGSPDPAGLSTLRDQLESALDQLASTLEALTKAM